MVLRVSLKGGLDLLMPPIESIQQKKLLQAIGSFSAPSGFDPLPAPTRRDFYRRIFHWLPLNSAQCRMRGNPRAEGVSGGAELGGSQLIRASLSR